MKCGQNGRSPEPYQQFNIAIIGEALSAAYLKDTKPRRVPMAHRTNKIAFCFLLSAFCFALFLFTPVCTISAQQADSPMRTLIVMFDGLRPDYITADNMPNVHALKEAGAYGLNNHSVFPTVTRVNASSYITGSYPAKHGLMGNTVYFPEVDKAHGLNTGEVSDLRRIAEATNDKLLTSPSLGALLREAGKEMIGL